TTQQTAWRFEADRVTATVRMNIRVRRGPLFHFALRTPTGYTAPRISSTPEDLVAYSGVAGNTVTIEFARPLVTGQAAELMFEFPGPALAAGSNRLAFPAFNPVGAAERVGVLGLSWDTAWSAEVKPGVGTVPLGWFDPFDPPPLAGAAVTFRHR